MPGVVMHHHFARVVYSALSDETKKKKSLDKTQ